MASSANGSSPSACRPFDECPGRLDRLAVAVVGSALPPADLPSVPISAHTTCWASVEPRAIVNVSAA